MQTIRIFISSPGDVAQERERASEVIQSLQRRYSRKFHLIPIFWENLPLEPDMSFQQGIDLFLKNPGVDIAVFILWSRLGSPLGASIRKADGSAYRSGTEREYDLMIQARAQSKAGEGTARPRMIVYTRRDDNSFDARLRGKSTAEKKDLLLQKELVESFMKETFKDAETGENIGAYHPFDRPVTFSQRLRIHLQAILDEIAGDMDEVIWDIDKQGPPFLGLDAFQPGHAEIFFGREEEILEARNALKEKATAGCAFLLLSGASGSGKSSLARAGILPEILAHEANEEAEVWKALIVTPAELGDSPILSLLRRLADVSLLPELNDQVPSFENHADDLASNADRFFQYSFPKAIEAAASRVGGSIRFVVVLDQLEELFTKDALSKKSRSAFLAFVETLCRSGHFWIIATARSDFYQDLLSEPALVRMKEGRGLLDVLPPQPDAIARLIEEPARLAGIVFEERDGQKLSSRILRDAANHAELLPLLEFGLLELFNGANGNQLTHAAYDELGGVEGALRRRAESSFNDLPEKAAETLGQVLEALVTLGDESGNGGELDKPVRLRAPLATFPEGSPARQLIDSFITARLFTSAQMDGSTEATFTVAHESLLRVWPRAVAWKNQNSDFLRTRARVAARMNEGSPLLDGDPLLAISKAFLVTRNGAFSASQRKWIEQSIAAAETQARQSIRRRRLALAALSGLTLFSAGAAIWAMRSAKEAVRQKTEADAGFDAARSTTDDFLSRIASEELSYIAGIQELREEMADKAIRQYEGLLKRKPGDNTLHLALCRARLARANILGQIGSLQEATNAFESTIKDIESLGKNGKSMEIDLLLASANNNFSAFQSNENLTGFTQDTGRSIAILQPLLSGTPRRDVVREAIWAFNIMGNAEEDRDKKIAAYEQGRDIGLRYPGSGNHSDSISTETLSGLAAVTWNLSENLSKRNTGEDRERSSKLRKESNRLYLDLQTARPNSPSQQKYAAILLQEKAKDLQKNGKTDDARQQYQECVSLWRTASTNNPGVTQFQRGLVLALKDYGVFLSEAGDFISARASYEESVSVSEKMIGKRADRPSNGVALLQIFYQLSEFEQYGKTNKDKGNPSAGAAIREKAINLGRLLLGKYPNSTEISFELGKTLANHARCVPMTEDPKRAAGLFREAIEVMEKPRVTTPSSLKSWNAESFLGWSTSLVEIMMKEPQPDDLQKASNRQNRIQILDTALEWQPYATDFDGKQQLMYVALTRSNLFREMNQPDQAVALNLKMIRLCESAYLEKPYHYYLRDSLAGQYRSLGDSYELMNQPEKELQARQKSIEIGSVPNHGRTPYQDVLSPTLAPTQENLQKLRTVSAWGPKKKMFVIPCNVNGVRVPVQFYIHGGTLDKDFDPIADQARWIEEERGVIVPADVRDSMRKLAKIAYDNKVDFMDLCTYALNYPVDDTAKKAPPTKTKPETRAAQPPPAFAPPDFAKSVDSVNAARRNMDRGKAGLISSIGNMAFSALFAGKYNDAELAAREGLKLASAENSKSRPDDLAELRTVLHGNLAHALLLQGKFDEALKVYRLHWNSPMQGRTFKDGVVEDFDLFEKGKVAHPDIDRMKKALGINESTPRVNAALPVVKGLPDWFITSMRAKESEAEITEKIRKSIDAEVTEKSFSRDLWTPELVIKMAKAQYLAFQEEYKKLDLSNRKGATEENK